MYANCRACKLIEICFLGVGVMIKTLVLANIRGIIVDIDGTLFRGDKVMEGAISFFGFLKEQKISFIIATNNTKSPKTYKKKFLQSGIQIETERIVTCATATAEYLSNCFGIDKKIYIIGNNDLIKIIREKGYRIIEDNREKADVVVVGGDFDLTYKKLKNAVLHIQNGAKFIGTNPDVLIPTEEGLVPEAGVTLAAIKCATGISPIIIGKPENILFDVAIERMTLENSMVGIIGDRLETDILGGKKSGMRTILVQTGVDDASSAMSKGIYPDLIVENLVELRELWCDAICHRS